MSREFRWLQRGQVGATLVIGGILAVGIFGAVGIAGAGSEQKSTQLPQPVVDTHELMELFNQQLYRQLREEMQNEPDSEQEWETIRHRGLQAAEVANLVAIRERGDDDPRWGRLARGLQQAGTRLAEVVRTEDFDQTQEAYRNLIQSCNACHETMAPQHAPTLQP